MARPEINFGSIVHNRHPRYFDEIGDWDKWRTCFEAGDRFRDQYLERFSLREDTPDFNTRKKLSPIPSHAASAIVEIRNSIFQRMRDISRVGGSTNYKRAIAGEGQGVDRRGSNLDMFLGQKVLDELLVMGRVGVFVDNPVVPQVATMSDVEGVQPYLYHYPIEDILSWSYSDPDEKSEFESVLLRDTIIERDHSTRLPRAVVKRYRLLWIDEATGQVNLQFLNENAEPVDQFGLADPEPYVLELDRIPFVMIDIGESLMKRVCDHQIALLNLMSSDVWYALKSNFTFYTEQRDLRRAGSHLKSAKAEDGSSMAGGQGADDVAERVGTMHGRYYDVGMDRPDFIAPPSEPLKVSMELRDQIEAEIRKLTHLAVTNIVKQQSAESKGKDKEGLEAGLSQIGLMLEGAERRIADYWAAYEERIESRREIATIKYPDSYSLKTDDERINESEKLSKIGFGVPSTTAKKEIAKRVVYTIFSGRLPQAVIERMANEVENAEYTTSDPEIVIKAKEAGLVSERVASMSLGYPEEEYLQAREDHVERVIRIGEAQSKVDANNPAARGVKDLAGDPNAGKTEKEQSRQTDTKDTTKKPVRGEGRNNKGDS